MTLIKLVMSSNKAAEQGILGYADNLDMANKQAQHHDTPYI
jgi:hypothetical protein